MADKGEYRGFYVALPDSPEFQALSPEARAIFYPLKLKLGKAGIDVFYPEVLPRLTGYPFERVSEGIQELQDAGWLIVEHNVYWIRNGLRFDPSEPLASPNQKKGIEAHIRTLPKLAIVNDFARYYDLTEPHPGREPFGKGFERVSEPLRSTEDGDGRLKEQNGAKAPADEPPGDDTGNGRPDPLKEARGEAATLIRTHVWLGKKPPETAGPEWDMKRDLSIWGQLLKQFRPDEVNGGISVLRLALAEDLPGSRPITMAYFARDGTRDRMSRCVAYWRRLESQKLAREKNPMALIGKSATEVARAATG